MDGWETTPQPPEAVLCLLWVDLVIGAKYQLGDIILLL
jgi:hypothetical protein